MKRNDLLKTLKGWIMVLLTLQIPLIFTTDSKYYDWMMNSSPVSKIEQRNDEGEDL